MDVTELEYAVPQDDGSYDWYASYGPRKKCRIELQKRHEADIYRKTQQEKEQVRLKEERDLEQREQAKVIQLTPWPDSARGVPNSVLRGSLFAAIQERYAKHVNRMVLHESASLRIVYTGMRLTQTDLDVWEYALHLARKQNLGYKFYFTERGFLKGLGRVGKKAGKSQHEWLKGVIARLGSTWVEITHNGKTYKGSLLVEGYDDSENERSCLAINPMMGRLFDAGYTLVDWNQRRLLGKKPLAQWLHGYISSHERWVPHKVETIKRYSGSSSKDLKSFRQKLKIALETLREQKIIAGFHIDDEDKLHIDMMQ